MYICNNNNKILIQLKRSVTAQREYAYMMAECNDINIWHASKANKNKVKVK